MNHSTSKATIGGLICNHGWWWIFGSTVNIGPQSSFMVELWGCHDGLWLASKLGATHLILEMDSLVVVQMIQTRKAREGSTLVLLRHFPLFGCLYYMQGVAYPQRRQCGSWFYGCQRSHSSSRPLTLPNSTIGY